MYTIPEHREAPVQEMFSAIAGRYDLNNSLLSFGLHHVWKETAVRMARIPRGGRGLDLCAGTCDIASLLARRGGRDARVDALDLNEPMLRIGATKLRRAGFGAQVAVVRGNMEHLPFPSESYDAATVGFGIRNVMDRDAAFGEMFRVLRPGARAVCLEFSRPSNPTWRRFYGWYNFSVLPHIGRLVARDKTRVYEYLPASIAAFPAQEELADVMRNAGFVDVTYANQCGGVVAIHVGVKPADGTPQVSDAEHTPDTACH